MAHFNALASSWWDVNGPQRILHKMNLLRMDFIYQTVRNHLRLNPPETAVEDEIYIPPYGVDLLPDAIKKNIVAEQEQRRDEILENAKLTVLDVGCGGGILSESMARLHFIDSVKGIDLSEDVLQAAKLHRAKDPMFVNGKLSYQLRAIEDLPTTEKYDIITMFEMLEHVEYPSKVLLAALERVEVGGWVFISTINRDFISWFTTIFMGEHVLGIVPVGTHTLDKYINQTEIREWFESDPQRKEAFSVVDAKGCVYLPAYGWKFTSTPDVGNYFMAIRRMK
ncbi:3,4-dihydroxy-5-hexaprenylbenzoate methyltransferase [Scheffersomyces stipitis CBS 6054]|uniref:3,4-dihydroxy-5-hexaprenylbenzoate methyltransferase n=1 Tax=Scheffersomyces stipitis (strain ATCC 58785 / CBS 6054 / NBRC 10063 / NRRL Y-11545) TaxID=322104 RepID=A3LV45_PICST|nr:3,4-dihydroxy-5-hexaprenylbenzoate methyltransferase [Scheffersomyces stipitis CBS 6054]ABN66711.1 3,4-dihydroxy-5-hexaprenylbenzoate methyltransferase [Scheffersomyces stipitis CBS 6054]